MTGPQIACVGYSINERSLTPGGTTGDQRSAKGGVCPPCGRRRCVLVGSSEEGRRFYSNKLARIYLVAIEDVTGSNGVAAILRLAKLGHLIGSYPPDNLDREFGFEEYSAVNQAIHDMYGPQGARGLCLRAGRATLKYAVKDGALMADLRGPAFEMLPAGAKVKAGLTILAGTLTELSDQVAHVREDGETLLFAVDMCPECWARASDVPICHGTTGMLQEALEWLSGGQDYTVVETECIAKGDDSCCFVIARRATGEAREESGVGGLQDSESA